MRIGLVYPNTKQSDLQVPLGIGYLAAYLRERMEGVELFAMDTGIQKPHEIQEFLRREYDLVGFSVSSRSYRESVDLMRAVKYHHPDTPIVYGGPHVSMVEAEALEQEPMIDYVVDGEGEVTFHELVSAMERAGGHPATDTLAGIDGLVWRDGDKVVQNAERKTVEDLDSLPFPAYDLFPVHRYPSQYPMATSRGCPFTCTFCTVVSLWGNRLFRVHGPARIVDEIEHRVATYGPRPVVIHDDAFNTQLQRMIDICTEMIDRKLRIPFGVRGFRIDILNEECAELLRRAGCTNVAIGVESANNAMLKRMQKGCSIEVMDKGVTMLRKVGIHVRGQFMIGNPGETLETVQESIDFARDSDLTSSIFSMAVPFPKTPLWDHAVENGRFLVERDVTRFDDVLGKVIFETPEFTRDQRIQARELAREAGFYFQRAVDFSLKRKLRDWAKAVWFRFLYPHLPRRVSGSLYFKLRDWFRGKPVTHEYSKWARDRGQTHDHTRMKASKTLTFPSKALRKQA